MNIYRGAAAVVPGGGAAVVGPVVTNPVVTSPVVTTVPMMATMAPGIAIGILKALFIGHHSHLLR